jgi:hypothetical protein
MMHDVILLIFMYTGCIRCIADALFRPAAPASKGFIASLLSQFSSLRSDRNDASVPALSPHDARQRSLSALWLLAGQPFIFNVSTWSLIKLAFSARTFVGGDALVRRVAQRWGDAATAHFRTPEAVLNPYLNHVRTRIIPTRGWSIACQCFLQIFNVMLRLFTAFELRRAWSSGYRGTCTSNMAATLRRPRQLHRPSHPLGLARGT